MSNLTVPSNPPGRRISQLLSAPSVEKVRGEDGSTTYHCVGTYSSLEDSDSSVANAQLKHKRGAKYGTVNSRFLVFVFSLLGGAVSIVFAIISSLSIILGDWVLLETAELLGFVALLFSAYLASAVLFEGWSCYCRKTILLNSSCVVALALVYASGELVCSLLVSVLPVLETTYLVLLGGWMLFFNAYFAQDVVHLTAFLQSKENCILVCSTVIQQAVMRLLFQAFLPATLLPLIAHSCHLAGLTLCLVVEEWLGGVSLAPRGRSTTPMYNRNSSGGSHKYSLLGQGMPVRKSTISFGKSSRSSRSSLLGLVSSERVCVCMSLCLYMCDNGVMRSNVYLVLPTLFSTHSWSKHMSTIAHHPQQQTLGMSDTCSSSSLCMCMYVHSSLCLLVRCAPHCQTLTHSTYPLSHTPYPSCHTPHL